MVRVEKSRIPEGTFQKNDVMREGSLLSTLLFASKGQMDIKGLARQLNLMQGFIEGSPNEARKELPWAQGNAHTQEYIKKLHQSHVIEKSLTEGMYEINEAQRDDILAYSLALLAYAHTHKKSLIKIFGYGPDKPVLLLEDLKRRFDEGGQQEFTVTSNQLTYYPNRAFVHRGIEQADRSGIQFFTKTKPKGRKVLFLTITPEQGEEITKLLTAIHTTAETVTPHVLQEWATVLLPEGAEVPATLTDFAKAVCENTQIIAEILTRAKKDSHYNEHAGEEKVSPKDVFTYLTTHRHATAKEIAHALDRSDFRVHEILDKLEAEGEVRRAGSRRIDRHNVGEWEVTPQALYTWQDLVTRINKQQGGIAVLVYDHRYHERNAFPEVSVKKQANVENPHLYVGSDIKEILQKLPMRDRMIFLDQMVSPTGLKHKIGVEIPEENAADQQSLYHALYIYDLAKYRINPIPLGGTFIEHKELREDGANVGPEDEAKRAKVKILFQVVNKLFANEGIEKSALFYAQQVVDELRRRRG